MAPVLLRRPAAERGYLAAAHRDRLPAVRIRAAVAASLADIDGGDLGVAEQSAAACAGFHGFPVIFSASESIALAIDGSIGTDISGR